MKKTILFLSIIFYIPYIDAMKRPRTYEYKKNNHRARKKIHTDHRANALVPFSYPSLPQDMQKIIFDFAIITTEKPKFATKMVNALTCVSKEFYKKFNEKKYNDEIIKKIAHRFSCSHETITWFLGTPVSQERLFLQQQLKNLCIRSRNNYATRCEQLDMLIHRGVDLEFTYNHEKLQKTALMICNFYKSNMSSLLLQKGADINGHNSHGWSALTLATMFPISLATVRILTDHPNIDVNKQNNRGETALLKTLIDRKNCRITSAFKNTIQLLLDAEADPELADRNGLTPLIAAKKLGDQEVIELISNAIEQKHAKGLPETR